MITSLLFRRSDSWQRTGCFIITIHVFCAFTGFTCGALANNTITFQFNPPDGTSFVETLQHTKGISEGLTEPVAQIEERKAEYAIRKTDFGYSVVVTPLQPSTGVSEDVPEMLGSLLANAVLTYDLDTQGKLLRVRGTEAIAEKLKRNPISDLLQLFSSVLGLAGDTAKQLEQLAARDWNNRVVLGFFAGRTVVLDEVLTYEGRISYPPIENMLVSSRLNVSGPIACNGKQCMKIRLSYESNDPVVGEKLGEVMRDLIIALLNKFETTEAKAAIGCIPTFQISNPKLMYKNERLVDATTGLIYSEVETITTRVVFGMQGGEKSRFTLEEKKEYFFTYKK